MFLVTQVLTRKTREMEAAGLSLSRYWDWLQKLFLQALKKFEGETWVLFQLCLLFSTSSSLFLLFPFCSSLSEFSCFLSCFHILIHRFFFLSLVDVFFFFFSSFSVSSVNWSPWWLKIPPSFRFVCFLQVVVFIFFLVSVWWCPNSLSRIVIFNITVLIIAAVVKSTWN